MAKRSVTFRPPTPADVDQLVAEMRWRDRAELLAASGPDYHDTLTKSVERSLPPGAALDENGELLCLFGAVPIELMGDEAVIWLVGTTRLKSYPAALTRSARQYCAAIRQDYPKLFNYVDARNAPSIRWLKRMGFMIEKPEPFGVVGLPFHRFHVGY